MIYIFILSQFLTEKGFAWAHKKLLDNPKNTIELNQVLPEVSKEQTRVSIQLTVYFSPFSITVPKYPRIL